MAVLGSYPFEITSIDVVGPLPETTNGNKYLLTIQDAFTRWPIAVPIPETSAKTIASAIFRHLLSVHGCPTKILTDRGTNLISKAVKELCENWTINKISTTGNQPQSVPVERFHRYLNHSMTMLHGRFGIQWDEYIDAALFVYRVSVNDTTGYSPFYLMYSREPVRPDDLILGLKPDNFQTPKQMQDSSLAKMVETYDLAWKRQLARAERNAVARDEFSLRYTFFPGQRVFFFQEQNMRGAPIDKEDGNTEKDDRVPSRWKYLWTGPHTVVERVEGKPNIYKIRHNETADVMTVNVNRLSLHVPWDDAHITTSRDPFKAFQGPDEPWKTTGMAGEGDLIVFELDDQAYPFGIGKLIRRNEDGTLKFQWVWNSTDNVRAPLFLGWESKTSGNIVYRDKLVGGMKDRYEPYTYLDKPPNDEAVLVHGFQLTGEGRRPRAVLKIISESKHVDWNLK